MYQYLYLIYGEEHDVSLAPSQAEKRLTLQDEEKRQNKQSGSVAWLCQGLSIEESQYVPCYKIMIYLKLTRTGRRNLVGYIRKIGKKPSVAEKNELGERRRRLQNRIDQFHREGSTFLGLPNDEVPPLVRTQNYAEDFHDDQPPDTDEQDEEEEEEEDTEEKLPEKVQLLLPSALTFQRRVNIRDLVSQEIQLRIGQANDALDGLRNSLAQVSLVFRTDVRMAKSQYKKTRAWGAVDTANAQVRKHVARYRTARNALIGLRAPSNILAQYEQITKDHLKMPGDIIEENRIGQRNDSLAWFWRLDGKGLDDQRGWMKECELSIIFWSQY